MKIKSYLMALALGLGAAASWATPLEDIERWAQESADALSIADLDSEIAKQRLEIVRAESGAKWTLGATVGQYQEPLTDTSSRTYSNFNATAGMRIPVIGSADANQRNMVDASRVARVNVLQRELQRVRILREVRLAYTAYVRNAQKAAMARAWLSLEEATEPVFLARTREHALLEADRMAMQSGFRVARRDLDRYTLAQDSALGVLRRLSKHALNDLPPEPPAWSTTCLQRQALLTALEQSPAVAIKRVELEARESQTQLMRWGGMEAGVTLQQSLGADFGGQGSQATVLGIDMTMPFEIGGSKRARASEAQLKVQQARLDLDQTMAEESDALDGVLGRLRISQTDLDRSQQNLDTSLETLRIGALRARNLPGDVLEKAFLARYALYLAAVDYLDTRQRIDAAQIDALAYGVTCPQPATAVDVTATLPALLSQSLAPGTPEAAPAPAPELSLAWFLWHGDALLQDSVPALPASTGRLQVSFTAEQLAAIQADANVAQNLRRNLEQLHSRGWQVDVLFGDASFVLPAGRKHLLQFVRGLPSFAFDGINLDLERSDLPKRWQPQWWKLTLATLRAVHASVAWPLALTTHYREFDQASRQADLAQAGVASVMAMVYVNDLAASTAIVQRIASKQAGLPVRVVQSVESQLPTAESGFASGRSANKLRWIELNQRLSTLPNFQGIAVQSLESFNAMQP